MKSRFSTIYRIELVKLVRRKDWLALVALCGMSLLFGFAVMTDGYTGVAGQSALYWVVSQVYNSSVLFITPLVAAFLASRIFSSEIENGSILMYTNKYRNRGRLYLAKSLALATFTLAAFVAMCLINLLTYYLLAVRNPQIASGLLFGENSGMLLLGLLATYLSSFLIASQIALVLGAFFKPTPVIGILFLLTLVSHFTYKVPGVNVINPWYYVVKMFNDTLNTSAAVPIESGMLGLVAAFLLLVTITVTLANFMGKRKFQAMDL